MPSRLVNRAVESFVSRERPHEVVLVNIVLHYRYIVVATTAQQGSSGTKGHGRTYSQVQYARSVSGPPAATKFAPIVLISIRDVLVFV